MSLRYAMIIPMALMIASVIAGCLTYSNAKSRINDDLNRAIASLVNDKSEILCRPDTIAAIKSMHKAVGQPICCRANDLDFSIPEIADNAYYTLRLAEAAKDDCAHFIESDSILLYDRSLNLGTAIELKGYVDCTMATVFSVSDKSIPVTLMTLSLLSMICIWYFKEGGLSKGRELPTPNPNQGTCIANPSALVAPEFAGVRLTPMQRRLVEIILSAPEHKVDKRDICTALWGNKSNAEESLYTLVKRTKTAIASTNMEIVCNRGDSYELRVKT